MKNPFKAVEGCSGLNKLGELNLSGVEGFGVKK